MTMLLSFTKISAMMTGEIEANDILELNEGVATVILISFVFITVVLLQNLMIAIAVGDVEQLNEKYEDELLHIKVDYCIEFLQLSELIEPILKFLPHGQRETNNSAYRRCENGTSERGIELGIMMNATAASNESGSGRDTTKVNSDGIRNEISINTELLGQKINNIVVIHRKKKQMFTKKIDLGENVTENNPPESRLNRVEFRICENDIIRREYSDIKKTTLEDNRSFFAKIQQFLIGINWNSFCDTEKNEDLE
ncbi:hypothetical protein FO519_010391, partial [Halicephalobus sp. NKZ332]